MSISAFAPVRSWAQGGDLPEVQVPSEGEWSAPTAILSPGPSGAWDERLAGPAPGSLIKKDGTYYLYYVGAAGDRSSDGGPAYRAVGLATSTDGQTWTKHPANPVIPWSEIHDNNGEEEGAWGVSAYVDDGEIILYVADLIGSGGTVNGDIRLFTSSDGVNFTDQGIVLAHNDSSFPGNDEKTPVAIHEDASGTWHLYYIGKGGDVTNWSLYRAWGSARDRFTGVELVQTAPSGDDRYGDGVVVLKDDDTGVKLGLALPRQSSHIDVLSVTDGDFSEDTREASYGFATQGAAMYLDRAADRWLILYGNGSDDVDAVDLRTAPIDEGSSGGGEEGGDDDSGGGSGPVALRGQDTGVADGSTSSMTLTLPQAPQEGSLLIAGAYSRAVNNNDPSGLPAPDGWTPLTMLNEGGAFKVWYKVASASESTSLTLSWELDYASSTTAFFAEWTGVDTSGDPLDTFGTATSASGGTSQTARLPSRTAQANSLLIAVTGVRIGGDGGWGWSDGHAHRDDTWGVAGESPVGLGWSSRIVETSGQHQTTASWSTSGNNNMVIAAFHALDSDAKAAHSLSDAESSPSAPDRFELHAPYPNPTQTTATLRFTAPRTETVTVALFDALGRQVSTLHSGPLKQGHHMRSVDVSNLASGTYFVRLHAESTVLTKRMTVVR